MRTLRLVVAALVLSAAVWGQARLVRASGDAVISAKPDQVKINVGVITTADSAQTAAAQNATQTEAVLARLKQALGAFGETRTVSYSINPNYRSGSGQSPVLAGFTASNTLEITSSDLSSVGAIIDAAVAAGANNVGGLRFTVKDDEPLRAQALAAAAKQARANAQAIAGGLGAQLGVVRTAQQGSAVAPFTVDSLAAGTTTPIEPGLVQVSATVTVEIDMI